jgi:D-glycero-D-manno-heptose 1,7-bisphosphate phosphatase
LLLDRDGVVNLDRGWVGSRADFAWTPGIFVLLRRARAAGHAVAIVTNQGGIARGYYSEADFRALTRWMLEEAAAAGAAIDRVIACPHHPEARDPVLRQVCACRKPGTLMIERAATELGLELARSALIGDKVSDIEAGRRAGVGRLLLHAPAGPPPAFVGEALIVRSLAEAEAALYGAPA